MIYVLYHDSWTAWWFMYCIMIHGLLDDLCTAWCFMYCLMIYVLLDYLCTAWWFMYCLMIYVLLDDLCTFLKWTKKNERLKWLERSWSFMNNFVLFSLNKQFSKKLWKTIIVLLSERFFSNKLFLYKNEWFYWVNEQSFSEKKMKKMENER